ncbi:MAG: hypothetical protein ABSF18_03170, partial [Gammaproteobacteria bacterium]
MNPALYEKNIELRCMLEEATRHSIYINMALTNVILSFAQVPIPATIEPVIKEEEKERPLPYVSITLILFTTFLVAGISILMTLKMSNEAKFGLKIGKVRPIFKELLSTRTLFIENEALLDQYIAELKAIKETQQRWINGLLTLRTLMAALTLNDYSYNHIMQSIGSKTKSHHFIGKLPSLGL